MVACLFAKSATAYNPFIYFFMFKGFRRDTVIVFKRFSSSLRFGLTGVGSVFRLCRNYDADLANNSSNIGKNNFFKTDGTYSFNQTKCMDGSMESCFQIN